VVVVLHIAVGFIALRAVLRSIQPLLIALVFQIRLLFLGLRDPLRSFFSQKVLLLGRLRFWVQLRHQIAVALD